MLLNVDLDHHATFGTRAEVRELFETWLAHVPHVVRAEELEPVQLELAVAGEHNRRNAAAAIAALELAGVPRTDVERVIVRVRRRGATARAQRRRLAACAVLDSYAHHPAELAADLAAVRNGGRVLALFQPHLYSRTVHLAHEFAVALATADAVCVTEIYAAREEPLPGVSGRLIVNELAQVRPGMRIGWAPALDDAARMVASWARAGRHGAHARCRRRRLGGTAAPGAARVKLEEGVELARFTTLGTGGPARAFARPESVAEVEELLRWAAERELDVATVGLGSNLLAADDGVDALVLKLGGELATVASDGRARAGRRRRRERGRPSSRPQCRDSAASSSPARSRARSAAGSG